MSVLNGPGEGTWAVFAERVVIERDRLSAENALLRRVAAVAHDLAKGKAAREKLDAGFNGMGMNILQEDAVHHNNKFTWEKLQKALDALNIESET